MTKSRRLAYLALSFNVLIWGAALPIVKPVFAFLSPMQYLYLRFLLAGIISFPIFLYFYIKKHPKISYLLKSLLLETVGSVVPLLLLYEGLSRTSSLEASLIGATGPIFVVLGGVWFLGERENKREWQGLALSLLGSCLLILEPLWNGQNIAGSGLYGNFLILLYNLVWTIYALIAKKFYQTKPPLALGSLTYLVTALVYALILSRSGPLPPLSLLASHSGILIPVLYMAIPGGVVAFALYLYAQSKIEVSEANVFGYLNGVVAIPAAYFLLGESPSWLTLLAITLIAYGVIRAEFRKK